MAYPGPLPSHAEPTHQQLLEYTAGVRQVVQLVETLEELHIVGRKEERQEDLDVAFSPPSGKLHEVRTLSKLKRVSTAVYKPQPVTHDRYMYLAMKSNGIVQW